MHIYNSLSTSYIQHLRRLARYSHLTLDDKTIGEIRAPRRPTPSQYLETAGRHLQRGGNSEHRPRSTRGR